jgi:MHS family shikimate/dehydroshikimate transporter-like MFS transporter
MDTSTSVSNNISVNGVVAPQIQLNSHSQSRARRAAWGSFVGAVVD